ncbi:MAG: hypothetical protein JWO69_1397, partial [Thermoleophilia bacterium]|nr:hypothetical protein [Thermoleophilia bacterium]
MLALGAVTSPAAGAAETLAVVAPVTDNYKAKWNADPSVREVRTFASADWLQAGGTSWKPTAPGDIVVTGGPVTVTSVDGRSGRLSVRVTQGSATVLLRYDHAAGGAKFGPLVTLTAPDAIAATPVRVTLTLEVDGATLATGMYEYR